MTRSMSSPFRFDVQKAVQAVGVILREEPGRRINNMKLLKLIEIAERESLRDTGTMITGDRLVAMDRGPLPSNIYNLIKGEHLNVPEWDAFIDRETYHVSLSKNPGVSRLSPFQIEKLREVTTRHANDDEWVMVAITHQFPEWLNNQPDPGSRCEIPVRDVLSAVGKSDEEVDAILSEATAQRHMDEFFTRNKLWSKRTPSLSPA